MAITEDENDELEELPMSEFDENPKSFVRIRYSPEQLMRIRDSSSHVKRPNALESKFCDSNGKWNPSLWHSSLFNNGNVSRFSNLPLRRTERHNSAPTFNVYTERNNTFRSNSSLKKYVKFSGSFLSDNFSRQPKGGESHNKLNGSLEPGIENGKLGVNDKCKHVKFDLGNVNISEARDNNAPLNCLKTSKSDASIDVCTSLDSETNQDYRSDIEPEWLSVSADNSSNQFDFGDLEELKKQYNAEIDDSLKRNHQTKSETLSTVDKFFASTKVSNDESNDPEKVLTLQDVESCIDSDNEQNQQPNENVNKLTAFNNLLEKIKPPAHSAITGCSGIWGTSSGSNEAIEGGLKKSRLAHLFEQPTHGANGMLPEEWNSDKVQNPPIPSALVKPSFEASWKLSVPAANNRLDSFFPNSNGTCGQQYNGLFPMGNNGNVAMPQATDTSHSAVLMQLNQLQSQNLNMINHPLRNSGGGGMRTDQLTGILHGVNARSYQNATASYLLYAQQLQKERLALSLAAQQHLQTLRDNQLLLLRETNNLNCTTGVTPFLYQNQQQQHPNSITSRYPVRATVEVEISEHQVSPNQVPDYNAGISTTSPTGTKVPTTSLFSHSPPNGLTPALNLMFQNQLAAVLQQAKQ